MTKSETKWRDASDLERSAMAALTRCRFSPATPVKRFARSMGAQLADLDIVPRITNRQSILLWSYCWHFRRQIDDEKVNAEAAARKMAGHAWVPPDELISHEYCHNCLTIRQRSDTNGPCKGPRGLREMEKPLCYPGSPATCTDPKCPCRREKAEDQRLAKDQGQ